MNNWCKKYKIGKININRVYHPEWSVFSINKHDGWIYFHLGEASIIIKVGE